MDGYYYSSDSPDDAAVPSPPGEPKPTSHPPPPPTKRSRRSVQKRVVSVPIAEADPSRGKGAGESGPPSDPWAWRKYGQKPIKGSPYPRGYYRCSSSKGCPARKQVERSRVDPTTLVVTYSFDHNHPWPAPKNPHRPSSKRPARAGEEREPEAGRAGPDEPEEEEEEEEMGARGRFGDLMIGAEFEWRAEEEEEAAVLLYGPMYGAALLPEERGDSGRRAEEEDALFAGLGELPECAVVFRHRRGFGPEPEPQPEPEPWRSMNS
ncbi:putative WRKY transcription factor 65 [Ananas comosus]|uniref:Putative WRKY transcription factor 65 n=1 Tax=Ananas comosus TaxID=4615 RepID=A0A199UDG9_ANACO|nr:putative WRKY transcription factor 65 [Ananas comosus]